MRAYFTPGDIGNSEKKKDKQQWQANGFSAKATKKVLSSVARYGDPQPSKYIPKTFDSFDSSSNVRVKRDTLR